MSRLILMLSVASLFIFGCVTPAKAQINWQTDYQVGLSMAKSSNKSIFLLFTGSSWCGACMRLENEVLSSQEFANLAGNRFVFVKLDFPMNLDSNATGQAGENLKVKSQFNASRFPTVVIVSPSGSEVTRVLGAPTGGVQRYTQKLLDAVQ